ncbi:unannotated protein [freshwater metagenome]|uniref:Unannotated protein n=1 Tax=freshwater metagenome TaxID=449393 RepID=A0A6J7SLD2_9ZZZZ
MSHYSHAERVYQWVACIGFVEHYFATDVGQAEAISVTTDTGDDAREYALGVGCIGAAKAKWVHDGDGTCAHGEDVAHDATDTGGCALIRLDKTWMVM